LLESQVAVLLGCVEKQLSFLFQKSPVMTLGILLCTGYFLSSTGGSVREVFNLFFALGKFGN
jgi:hypothetical protein